MSENQQLHKKDSIQGNSTQEKNISSSEPTLKTFTPPTPSIQAKLDDSPLVVSQRKRIEQLFNTNQTTNYQAPTKFKQLGEEEEIQMKEDNSLTASFDMDKGKDIPVWSNALQNTNSIQRKKEEKEPLQMKSNSGASNKLPEEVQAKMESSFNTDFSDVSIHNNSSNAKDLNALAYTQGTDIHFAPGQYNPESQKGQELLGHELTHVVQQRQGNVKPTTQLKGAGINNDAGLEKEADEMGKKAAEGKEIGKFISMAVGGAGEDPIQRFEAPGHEATERTALTADNKFSNDEASMVYYGNWMRDMNQALVPSLAGSLGVDVVFALVNFLGYKKFGRYMNAEQFGYYIPSEHMDNPAGQLPGSDFYSSAPKISQDIQTGNDDRFHTSQEGARPTNFVTAQESVDPATATVQGANIYSVDQTGVLAYIRRTNLHVERRLEYAASKGRTEEGLMHFGAAMHAIEDLFAHSNFVEIAVDKVLKESPAPGDQPLVPELKPDERYVRKMTSTVNDRPVLTTGTFTGLDTMESVGAEGIKMLREGLGPVGNKMEVQAQDKFVGELLKKADGQAIKSKIVAQVDKMNLNFVTKSSVKYLLENYSIYDIYTTGHTIAKTLGINLQILDQIKNSVREDLNNNVLRPAADEIEARLLVTKVQDTPLYKGEKENQEVIKSNGTKLSPMQEIAAQITNTPPDYAANLKDAQNRKALFDKTPGKIKAGPSHSQISKDHKDSIFFGLAFRLAVEADKLLRDKMLTVWGTTEVKDPDRAILNKNYKDLNLQQQEEYSFVKGRKEQQDKSLQFGKDIYNTGHAPGQTYSLQNIRNESATDLEAIALVLDQLVVSPGNVRNILNAANGKLAKFSKIETATKKMISSGITTMIQGTYKMDDITAANQLKTVSDQFHQLSAEVKVADTLEEREKAYKNLITARDMYVDWVTRVVMAQNSYGKVGAPAYIIFAASIDKEMASVAPAYPKEQIDLLADPNNALKQENVNLPSFNNVPNPNVKALLETSRMIINHPYENDWWKPHVVDFMKKHSAQMAEEVRARNAGYVKFDGNHSH